MAYITESQLLQYPASIQLHERALANMSANTKTASTRTTVFLSHSHTDSKFVEPAVSFLRTQGVIVYIDWKDPSMPAVTSPETARRIKARIKECRKFVMLASNNALDSRWVPWELGVADSNSQDIAILPVKPNNSDWQGNEYVGIYPRIEATANGGWGVFPPGQNTGQTLEAWLLS